MKRRDFLKLSAGAAAVGLLGGSERFSAFGAETQPATPKWFKGNFHAHSLWSDGQDLPEIVVDAYKKRGYDFFSLTEHHRVQSERLRFDPCFGPDQTPKNTKPFEGETSFWRRLGANDARVAKARELFGADSVRTIDVEEGTYVRMKTAAELKKQFEEPEKFLYFSSFEMSSPHVHANLLNVDEDFYLYDADVSKLVSDTYDKAREMYDGKGRPWLFMLNHPMWQNYNIQPSALIARPEIMHVELNNNTSNGAYLENAWTPESFWDVVNAHRAANEQAPLYAHGTDDSHGVFNTDFYPFLAWSCVRAKSLDVASIFEAMNRGDSYASTGLDFSEIEFDGKTLAVRLDPKVEGEYRIEFIGTKKDYDPTPKYWERPAEHGAPARVVEQYSDEIGKKLAVVDGLEGSYTLKSDDLYVRARAYRVGAPLVDSGPSYLKGPTHIDSAWSQPFRPFDR